MIEGRIIGLLLIQNVRELVVHRVEVVSRHDIVVTERLFGQFIDLAESDLIPSLSTTDRLTITAISRDPYSLDDSGTITLEELIAEDFCVGIKPEELGDDRQLGCLS